MADEPMSRCEHLACLCEVKATVGTCSAYCASPEGQDALNVLCKCGHSACESQIDKQLHGEGGRESI